MTYADLTEREAIGHCIRRTISELTMRKAQIMGWIDDYGTEGNGKALVSELSETMEFIARLEKMAADY